MSVSSSSVVDLAKIVEITMQGSLAWNKKQIDFDRVADFLRYTYNLSWLQFCFNYNSSEYCISTTDYCSIVPLHVKHLKISINTFDDIIIILERYSHLSSAQFSINRLDSKKTYRNLENWLDENRNGSRISLIFAFMEIWLGKDRRTSTNKRLKVAHNRENE